MQQGSCEEIHLLISRYVDDEVTPEEHALVESHVATCEQCAYRLLQWVEMAVVVAETPMRQAAPDLRANLFRAIHAQKEETARKEERVPADLRAWRSADAPLLASPSQPVALRKRLFKAANPVLAAAVPVFLLIGSLLLATKLFPQAPVTLINNPVAVPPIATSEAPVADASDGVPPPESTKVTGVSIPSPAASTQTYMSATATLGPYTLLELRQPTPVWEEGDANSKSDWHFVLDPLYGYKVGYPSNWWTQVLQSTRYFYPWSSGGTEYAPYWIELTVSENPQHLTSETGNNVLCDGACKQSMGTSDNTGWIDRKITDGENQYREGFLFDQDYIYSLKLTVPNGSHDSVMGDYKTRYTEGDGVFTTMSGRLNLRSEQRAGGSAFGGTLFLKGSTPDLGSDLYLAFPGGSGNYMTYNGGVKNYALSPSMDRIAYATTIQNQARDPWAKNLYVVNIGPDGKPQSPRLLVGDMDTIQDIAWYSDRELVFIGKNSSNALSLYKLEVPLESDSSVVRDVPPTPEHLITLHSDLAGARALAVAPDRQLITFLAPLGANTPTDLYGVRPDGSDLHVVVSHSSPISIWKDGKPVLAPESQAIKSYTWMDGHLEHSGYVAHILFTSGNNYSPTFVLGGALYSGPRQYLNPLLDPFKLVTYKPESLRIIHIAYSSWGKVAFTGYYNEIDGRIDKLEGLWIANVEGDHLSTPQRLKIPQGYNGVTDLQWSPDGESLIYRETMPTDNAPSARYNGEPNFRIMQLDLTNNQPSVLFNNAP